MRYFILIFFICSFINANTQFDELNKEFEKYKKMTIIKNDNSKKKKKKQRNINWKRYYKHSGRYSNSIAKWSNHYGLDSNIVKAVISWESNWSAKASYKGCNGLMQVQGGSFKADRNIKQGCSILAKNLKRFGNYYHALMGYNLGSGKAARFIRKGRSWNYSERVLDIAFTMSFDSHYKNNQLVLNNLTHRLENEIQDNNYYLHNRFHRGRVIWLVYTTI